MSKHAPPQGEPAANDIGSQQGQPAGDKKPINADVQFGPDGISVTLDTPTPASTPTPAAAPQGEPATRSKPPEDVADLKKIPTKHLSDQQIAVQNLKNSGMSEDEAVRRVYQINQAQPPTAQAPAADPFAEKQSTLEAQMKELEAQRKAAAEDADMDAVTEIMEKKSDLKMEMRDLTKERADKQAQAQAAAQYEAQEANRQAENQVALQMVKDYPDLQNPQSNLAQKVEEKLTALRATNSPMLSDPTHLQFITQASAGELGIQPGPPPAPPEATPTQAPPASPFAAFQPQAPPQAAPVAPQPLPGHAAPQTPQDPLSIIQAINDDVLKVTPEQEQAIMDKAIIAMAGG